MPLCVLGLKLDAWPHICPFFCMQAEKSSLQEALSSKAASRQLLQLQQMVDNLRSSNTNLQGKVKVCIVFLQLWLQLSSALSTIMSELHLSFNIHQSQRFPDRVWCSGQQEQASTAKQAVAAAQKEAARAKAEADALKAKIRELQPSLHRPVGAQQAEVASLQQQVQAAQVLTLPNAGTRRMVRIQSIGVQMLHTALMETSSGFVLVCVCA